MAEGARFELADELPHLRFSRPARSAAPSPLQAKLASADIVQYPIWDCAVYGVPVGLVNTLPRFLIEEILTTHPTHDRHMDSAIDSDS